MKKLISLILVFVIVLGLCACGNSGGADETTAAPEGLQIGYAKINITPDYSVGLRGYSNAEERMSQGFVTYIFATCIAASEGAETILMYTVDTIAMEHETAERYRTAITEATGIPGDKIFFGATHSHSCPDRTTRYDKDLTQWLIDGAQQALADRSAATMLAGTQVIPNMNFVRHYLMEDGTYSGSNFGNTNQAYVGHATDPDPQMVLVKFDREGDKKDVLLVNWQAHPDSASKIGYNSIAASWVGPLRDELESLCGMHVAYFTGASGNQNMDSNIPTEKHNLEWDEYGVKMGQLANEALSCLQPVNGTGIKTYRQMLEVEIDHSWDHLLDAANQVYALWKSAGKSAGDALGRQYDFTSSYQARAIRTRAGMDKTTKLEINAFSIDGVGFTTGTYEMFSNHSLYVKEHSPFDVTFVITGCSGYIPNPEAYDYRSYEADTGYFAKGAGEKLAEEYVKMLESVK